MSCDWNVHCLDCKDTHRFDDANHRSEVMEALCRHAAAIAGLVDLIADPAAGGWSVRLATPWGDADPAWFRQHLGHNLVPIDEYGAILNQCHEWIRCQCGAAHQCGLDRGHDGEHRRSA